MEFRVLRYVLFTSIMGGALIKAFDRAVEVTAHRHYLFLFSGTHL